MQNELVGLGKSKTDEILNKIKNEDVKKNLGSIKDGLFDSVSSGLHNMRKGRVIENLHEKPKAEETLHEKKKDKRKWY